MNTGKDPIINERTQQNLSNYLSLHSAQSMVCSCWMSVVLLLLCIFKNRFKEHLLNYWVDMSQTLHATIILKNSLPVLQIVVVHCTPR